MGLTLMLIVFAVIVIICVFFDRITSKLGVPMLLAFILLGMVFGSDGLFKIDFENFEFAEQFCSVALIFIIFYGGFGTNWREGKQVAAQSILLSSAGVILTALLAGVFCRFALGFDWEESLLIGAVLSSTDAASVFSVLRRKKLGLKYSTASMLELESGSNDPWAYMLTVVMLSVMQADFSAGAVAYTVFAQVVFGSLGGLLFAAAGVFALRRMTFTSAGFDTVFMAAVALLAYAVPTYIGGNGYLSAYIVGIVLGNSSIPNKKALVNFFDGITGLAQMGIFFMLGLLSFPSRMPQIILPAVLLFLFLTFIARPLSVGAILLPFRTKPNAVAVVSWAGLRGATSIVFAIMATVSEAHTYSDIFHIVFCVVLLSIGIQGSLLPKISGRLGMIDADENVMKTFNDYTAETQVQFISLELAEGHAWIGCRIKDITLPPKTRIVLILRDEEKVIPKGGTLLCENDSLILSAIGDPGHQRDIRLTELEIDKNHEWCNTRISDITLPDTVIVLIRRKNRSIIPTGSTVIKENDAVVVINAK